MCHSVHPNELLNYELPRCAGGGNALTRWADAPVGHLSFINNESVRVGRGETGRIADGAVHVNDEATLSAYHVVMVITNAIFVEGDGARGLNATNETVVDKEVQRVVDRLPRDSADGRRDGPDDGVGGCVRHGRHGVKDRQALGGGRESFEP